MPGVTRRLFAAVAIVAWLVAGSLASPVAAAQTQPPKMADFNSAHVDMQITVATQNVTVTIPGSGNFEVNPANRSVRMQFKLSAMGETFEIILIDQKVYIKTGSTGPWQEMDTSQQANRATMNMLPQRQIANLQGAVSYRQAGSEVIDGTATTRWDVAINAQQLADFFMMFPGMTGGQVANPTASSEQVAQIMRDARIGGQMWIANDTGYLKRMQMDITLQVPQAGAGQVAMRPGGATQEVRERIVMTFSRYNEPVNIVAPPNAVPFATGPNVGARQPQPPVQPRPPTQMPAGQPRPQVQMPRPAAAPAAPMPRTMPRTGDEPLWPLGVAGLLLVGVGVAARQLPRRRPADDEAA